MTDFTIFAKETNGSETSDRNFGSSEDRNFYSVICLKGLFTVERIGNSTDILLLQQRRETSTALSVSGEEYRKRSTHVTLDKLLIAQKFEETKKVFLH